MNADSYQTAAARTLIDEPDSEYTGNQIMLVWTALGLAGEAGEVCDDIKKSVFHQHGLDRDRLVKELGDVAWYLSGICTLIGVPLSEVFERNISKLKQRYPNGYASADSKARVDVAPAKPIVGALDTCSMCKEQIVFVNPYWDHLGELKPRHPAIPTSYEL